MTDERKLTMLLSGLSVGPKTLVPKPTDPGYCFLHLAAPAHFEHFSSIVPSNPTVRTVQVYFDQYPGNFASGTFSAQIGTAYGLSVSQTRHVAVFPVLSSESRLSAKSLLDSLPPTFYVGGLTEGEPTLVTTAAHGSVPIPPGMIGSVNPAPKRSLIFVVPSGHTGKEVQNATIKVLAVGQNSDMVSLASAWSVVLIPSFKVQFTPTVLACGYHCSVTWAWIPSNDSKPNNKRAILNYPNSGYLVLAPSVPGGFWTAPVLTCPLGTDLLSSMYKPDAAIGAFPSLAVYTEAVPLPGQAFHSESILFDAVVSLEVQIGF